MKKTPHFFTSPLNGPPKRAFTLVELLAVIAVMVVLISFTGPLLGSLRTAGGMNKSVADLSTFLEHAQAYAMANKTYVWVGFYEDTTKPSVTIAAVAGITGAVSDIDTPATQRLLNKAQVHFDLRIHTVTGLSGMAASADDISQSGMQNFSQNVAGHTRTFKKVIQFTPRGGARVKPTTISRWIQIGLQPMNGDTPNDKNTAALQVAGLSGQVRIFRK